VHQELCGMDNPKEKKSGRPAKLRDTTLSLKVWRDLKDALDQAAADDGRTTSQYVERALIAHLQELGKWPK
jgi:uncharacterized protein (DUF1778 family)